MNDTDEFIVIHHVGGRGSGLGGFLADQIPNTFQDSIRLVVYDADPNCLKLINERLEQSWASTEVLPYFIGSVEGKRTFNLRYDPHTSSAARLKDRYNSFYSVADRTDYVLGDVFDAVETFDVETTPMDTLFEDGKHPVPDFLSMDVCGVSYDVYLGAHKSLESHILAIVDNMTIPSLYEETSVFPDSIKLLEQHGFDFVEFHRGGQYAPVRRPIGQRGRRYTMMCDTIFLKRLEAVTSANVSENIKYLQLRKLAFFALCLGYIETGLLTLEASREIDAEPAHKQRIRALSYDRFLNDVEIALQEMQERYLPLFVEKFTAEESHSRFLASDDVHYTGLKARAKRWLKENPALLRMVRFVRKDRGWLKALRRVIDRIRYFGDRRSTPLEQVLRKYNLREVAELVRQRRLEDQ